MKGIWIFLGIWGGFHLSLSQVTYANVYTLKELATKKVAETLKKCGGINCHEQIPQEIVVDLAKSLNPIELSSLGKQKAFWTEAHYRFYREQFFSEFVDIPEVTQEEADLMVRISKNTRIVQAIPAFRAQITDVSIGQFRAFLKRDPEFPESLTQEERIKTQIMWDQNEDLPATFVSLADQYEFAAATSHQSGREFTVPSADLDEYMRRGRERNPDGSFGGITMSRYYFGNALENPDDELKKRAWVWANSGHRARGVHEVVGPEAKDHPFGLINIVGNVNKRAADGSIAGGSFQDRSLYMSCSLESDYRNMGLGNGLIAEGFADKRKRHFGFRMVEVVPARKDVQTRNRNYEKSPY